MSALQDAVSLLLLPFAASVMFVLIHAHLGVHVLRRNIIFADLALAQLSALGATVAFAAGHAAGSLAGFGYGLAGNGLRFTQRPEIFPRSGEIGQCAKSHARTIGSLPALSLAIMFARARDDDDLFEWIEIAAPRGIRS